MQTEHAISEDRLAEVARPLQLTAIQYPPVHSSFFGQSADVINYRYL